MAKIEDLIAQIPGERLKKAIGAEVRELKKNKKFGLVFEEHLPETVRLGFNYCIAQDHADAELYIDVKDATENKRIFDNLHQQKDIIEKSFGGPLVWKRLDTKKACRIKSIVERGGYRSPVTEWPQIQSEMVDTMSKLEAALKTPLESLGL